MSNQSNIAETLRNARGEVDLIAKLKEGSLEARRSRISEALSSSEWDGGPAELVASYPHHVIALKEGVLMRIPVSESEGDVVFGKPDIYSIPTPVTDISTEVMETAKAAVEHVLSENFDAASPMIRGIVGALDVKGDLQRRLSMAVQLKSLARRAWWQDTISEQFAAEVSTPESVATDEIDEMVEAIDGLDNLLREGSACAVSALRQLHDTGGDVAALECAADIAEDLKSAVSILGDVDRTSLSEMQQVHEEVRQVVPRLLAGINFLTYLTGAKT